MAEKAYDFGPKAGGEFFWVNVETDLPARKLGGAPCTMAAVAVAVAVLPAAIRAGMPLPGTPAVGIAVAGTPAAFIRVAGAVLPVRAGSTQAGSAILTRTHWTR